MTWTDDETRHVQRSLLGSWPGTITQWGKPAFDAYLYVLQARGLSAEQVIRAIGTWPAGTDFPPSAPNLAAAALRDPSEPTFDEMLLLLGRAFRAGRRPLTQDFDTEAQMIGARQELVRAAARAMHPSVASFVVRCSDLGRLEDELAELNGDGEYAGARRRDMQERWERHCGAIEGREVAALASGGRRGLRQLDPLAALGISASAGELAAGDESSSEGSA